MCAGASAGAQAYPRTRVPERACVYVCTGARVCAYVCAYVCARARAWVDSSHPFIYQPPYRACARVRVSAYRIWGAHNAHVR
jgi:hypothetical protein